MIIQAMEPQYKKNRKMEALSGGYPSSQNPDNKKYWLGSHGRTTNNIISTNNIMNKWNLNKLSKTELISLLLNKPTPATRTKRTNWSKRPVPKPRKSVKQLIQAYEQNIIAPPAQFEDKPVLAPRTT